MEGLPLSRCMYPAATVYCTYVRMSSGSLQIWERMSRGFADKLRFLRIQHGFSQSELARQLDLSSPSHINNLEADRREPSLQLVLHTANVLGVTTDYLLRDEIPPREPEKYSSHAASEPAFGDFGEKLQFLRQRAGWTQVTLAERLGLAAHTHVSFMESGRKVPSIDLIVKIADLFGVSTDYLLRDDIALDDPRSATRTYGV